MIQGRYLDAGSRVTVSIGQPCEITFRNTSLVVCTTSPSATVDKVTVAITFDLGRRTLDEGTFEYLQDPTVTAVDSFGAGLLVQGPRGTPSGGSYAYVDGTQFTSVATPQIVIYYNGREYTGDCEVQSDVRLLCRSPTARIAAAAFSDQRTVDRAVELDWGFRMDGVLALRNLSRFEKFRLFPDPVVYNFSDPNGVKYHKSEYMFIDGENLNHAYRMEDYIVEIGMGQSRSFRDVERL